MLAVGAAFRERIGQTQLNRVLYRVLLISIASAIVLCVGSMLGDGSAQHIEILTLGMFAVTAGSVATLYDRGTLLAGVGFGAAYVGAALWPAAFGALLVGATVVLGVLSIKLLARRGVA
jgi:hypothetical protein